VALVPVRLRLQLRPEVVAELVAPVAVRVALLVRLAAVAVVRAAAVHAVVRFLPFLLQQPVAVNVVAVRLPR